MSARSPQFTRLLGCEKISNSKTKKYNTVYGRGMKLYSKSSAKCQKRVDRNQKQKEKRLSQNASETESTVDKFVNKGSKGVD